MFLPSLSLLVGVRTWFPVYLPTFSQCHPFPWRNYFQGQRLEMDKALCKGWTLAQSPEL